MKHYLDIETNEIYAYEEDGSQDALIKTSLVPLTEAEVADKTKPTPEEVKAESNGKARAYLSSTDWYLLRELDGGVSMPSDVKQLRVDARAKVS